ncbi:MAG: hypothetical protein ABEJ22_06835 [Haloferacaceae archaeon]
MDRSSRTTLVVSLLVVALLVVAAFAFVDFHAATTRTAVQSSTATSSVNGATLPSPGPVSLFVASDDTTSRRLGAALTEALESRGYEVTAVDSLRADYDASVLVVGVPERSLRYDPVTPSATLSVRFLFVDSGNLSNVGERAFEAERFREDFLADDLGVVRLDGETRFVREGTLTVQVRQTGVVSAPAFRRTVAETAGEAVVANGFDAA